MKTKTWLTTAFLAAGFFISPSAWADKLLSDVSSDPKREVPASAVTLDCTTEERMQEVAKENSFAQDRLGEVKDVGANLLGAALSIFGGVDLLSVKLAQPMMKLREQSALTRFSHHAPQNKKWKLKR